MLGGRPWLAMASFSSRRGDNKPVESVYVCLYVMFCKQIEHREGGGRRFIKLREQHDTNLQLAAGMLWSQVLMPLFTLSLPTT